MQVQDLDVVLKVAEFKSIKQAAESLDLTVATASAAVKRVEKAYGITLFIRSTRQLRLSAAGERYLPDIAQALLILGRVGQRVRDDENIVEGDLRLALPSDLGRNLVLPWLDEFLDRHPRVRLRLHVGDLNADFYRDPVDVALRYGAPREANLYGFRICQIPRVLCASPAYLQSHGEPQTPQDLLSHNVLLYQLRNVIDDVWEFTRAEQRYRVKVVGNRAGNDAELVRRWCVAGKGIAAKSILDMSQDLLAGRLKPVLSGYHAKRTELWLICPDRHLITPAVRLLREHVTERCAEVISALKEAGILTDPV